MIVAWIYFLICKLIGLTTKLLFKTDTTKELRKKFIEEFIEYMTGEKEKIK